MTYFFMMTNEEIDYRLAAEKQHTGAGVWEWRHPTLMLERIQNATPKGRRTAHLSEKPRFSKTCSVAERRSPSNRFMNKDMKSKSISPLSVAGR